MSDSTPSITSGSRHASFVVRVWAEPATLPTVPGADAGAHGAVDVTRGTDSAHGMRGSVELVGSRALRYFSSLDAMREIIAEVVERSSTFALWPPDSNRDDR